MPKGTSIHIGLNVISERHYGSNGELPYCVNDANRMAALARTKGYSVKTLLDEKATSTALSIALAKAADKLEYGDKLMLTYSGHGGYLPDLNGDEDDKLDETWLLYDRMFIDDELYYAFSKFKKGVRILVISDSCHSGTVAKPLILNVPRRELDLPGRSALSEILKTEALLLYRTHKQCYDKHLKFLPKPEELRMEASIILLASCSDNELSGGVSRSGRKYSLFTDELLTVYEQLGDSCNYRNFLDAIKERIPKRQRQTPNYFFAGNPNTQFEEQTPFSI